MQLIRQTEQPTHFIEVWSNGIYTNNTHSPYHISDLEEHLSATIIRNLKTIAIFKIYPKCN